MNQLFLNSLATLTSMKRGFIGVALVFIALCALISVFLGDVLFAPYGVYATRRLALSLLLAVFVVAVFWGMGKGKVSLQLSKLEMAGVALFTLCTFIAISISPHLLSGFAEALFTLFFLLAVPLVSPIMLGVLAIERDSLVWFYSVALSFGLAAYGAMTISVYLFAVFDGFAHFDKVIPWGFVSIRYWSHVASWCLPLLPVVLLHGPLRRHRLWRWGIWLGAGLWWWMIFLTSSRGSFFGMLLAVCFCILLFGKAAYPWARCFGKQVLLGVLFWLVLSVAVPTLIFEQALLRVPGTDSSGRMPLWLEAWEMSLANFPFGMGAQAWLWHDIITPAYEASTKFGHPHNMYLMWAAEYGWLAVFGLGLIAVSAAKRLWERARASDTDKTLLIGFTVSTLAALIHAGVSAVFIAPASMIVGFFVLSGFWALIHEQPAQDPKPEPPGAGGSYYGRLAVKTLLAGVVALWLGSVVLYYQAMRADEVFYQMVLGEGHKPRFWFHGDFPR